MGERILVTGAAGFIGRHLCEELAAHGHDVTGVDRVEGDLRLPDTARVLVASVQPDVVVHLAAQVGRVFGEDDIDITITNNALATARVAQATQQAGARLVYVSTSEVYGDRGVSWCTEGGPMVVPHNAYGLTKRHGEELASLYAPDGLQVIRLSMPYGPGLPAGRGRAAIINLLHQAHYRQPMTVHHGASRCWCWIGDTVRGMRLVIEKGEQGEYRDDVQWGTGVYNVGRSDNEVTMHRVAQIACGLAGAPLSLIRDVTAPANQTVVKRLSNDKLKALGWAPTVDLEEGMRRTYEVVKTFDADGNPTDGAPPPVVLHAPAAEGGAA